MTAAIEVEGLAVRYGEVAVLSDVTFHVDPGHVFAFVGANGAGKTTTLRALAALLLPDRGTIRIAGVDARRDPEGARRQLGYMPDHAGVYERTTVCEYLAFFAGVQGIGDARVADVLAMTGLEGVSERDVSALSKGMKQRLQLARVLLHDPSVLVLDEPASDLDPRARIELRDLILSLRRAGKTILLSSHILAELADVSTHVGILEAGRMVAFGPIDAIGAKARALRAPDAATVNAPYRVAQDAPRAARVRVLGSSARALAILTASPGVRDAVAHGVALADDRERVTTFSVRYADERSLGRAVKALSEADVLVCAVEPEGSELERIFLELTRGGEA